jgi:hypothetical protein
MNKILNKVFNESNSAEKSIVDTVVEQRKELDDIQQEKKKVARHIEKHKYLLSFTIIVCGVCVGICKIRLAI